MQKELSVAIEAVREAAMAVLRVYRRPQVTPREKSGGRGPLTEADLVSNELLIRRLHDAFPDDAILSEEQEDSSHRLGHRRCWVIDPLDGTREFVQRVPQFVVSLGLAVDRQPVLGVLLNPVTGELFTGVVGEGATYNQRACTVTRRSTLEGARLLVSATEHRAGLYDHIAERVVVEPVGSVAYKCGLVAAGKADATFTPRPRHEWDILGGTACILAAGGRVTDGQGDGLRFNRANPLHVGLAATNSHLHDEVMALLQRAL